MKILLFFLLSLGTLAGAVGVVTLRELFRAAMSLIAMLLGMAGLYLLLNAQFLSAAQVMVYVGGTVVLIVFVVLLVSQNVTKAVARAAGPWQAVAGLACVLLFALLVTAVHLAALGPAAGEEALPQQSATVTQIGLALLSPERGGYLLPFEMISVLLIAALVGAVTVARASKDDPT